MRCIVYVTRSRYSLPTTSKDVCFDFDWYDIHVSVDVMKLRKEYDLESIIFQEHTIFILQIMNGSVWSVKDKQEMNMTELKCIMYVNPTWTLFPFLGRFPLMCFILKTLLMGFEAQDLSFFLGIPYQRISSKPMRCIIICKNTFLIVTYSNSTCSVCKSNTKQNLLYSIAWPPYSQEWSHIKKKTERQQTNIQPEEHPERAEISRPLTSSKRVMDHLRTRDLVRIPDERITCDSRCREICHRLQGYRKSCNIECKWVRRTRYEKKEQFKK